MALDDRALAATMNDIHARIREAEHMTGIPVAANKIIRDLLRIVSALATPTGGDRLNAARPLPISRDELGRTVREAWVRWARQQSSPKPSWLVPYHKLAEADKEADRQIGEAVARMTIVFDAASAALASAPAPSPLAPVVEGEDDEPGTEFLKFPAPAPAPVEPAPAQGEPVAWRPVEGNPAYEVSSDGELRRGGKILAKNLAGEGYVKADMYTNGVRTQTLMHRLVALAFIPNPDNLPEVNHLDGDRTNNRVSNLEWVSRADNMNHAYYTLGRLVKPVRATLADGTVERFPSIEDAARNGHHASRIWACLYGHSDTHHARKWEFDSETAPAAAIRALGSAT